jgi:uncharacterized protein (TIGR03118 family)
MRDSTRNLQHTVLEGKHKRQSRKRRPAVEGLEERALLSAAHDLAVHKHSAVPVHMPVSGYKIIPLASDISGKAQLPDPSLVDPWDINFPQDKHNDPYVWVADQGTGVATMYKISNGSAVKKSLLTVYFPAVAHSTQTGPTGVVFNSTNKFRMPAIGNGATPAVYIFDTLAGTIEGWSPAGIFGEFAAEIVVDNHSTAEYTGLADGSVDGKHYIYAANDAPGGGIEVYSDSFDRRNFKGDNFAAPKSLDGFTPYGVHDLGNDLYVTYRGPNNQGGAVAEFANDGRFMRLIASNGASGPLQSPWGMAAQLKRLGAAQAPIGFGGKLSTDLLVGNFSSGQIDAYNVTSGQFEGTLDDKNGNPLTIPGLRTIHFGPGLGASGHTKIAILFTADIDNGNHGLYGEITPAT